MSLLDGFPTSKDQALGAFGAAKPVLEKLMDPSRYPPRVQSALEQAKAGMPIAGMLNLSSRELDALFNQTCRALQYGERQKARDSALMLALLKPLESRYLYLLAATYQAEGDYETAGKLYISFLFLDATNPDGYLRLGECFLANKEADMAIESFRMASKFAAKGSAPDQIRAYAQQMAAAAEIQLGAAKN